MIDADPPDTMQPGSIRGDVAQTRRISVVGLGKLGAPLAAVLAGSGFEVTGVDRKPKFVAALREGIAPVAEPGLQELLATVSLRVTTELHAAVLATDVTFILVPTPSTPNGTFSHAAVVTAASEIGAAIRGKSGYHLVVISSTVMPGATDGPIRKALETASDRLVGDQLGLCYSPEFVALGSVIRDLHNPDFVLIGESDRTAGNQLEAIYQSVCKNDPPIRRMNLVNAEVTKLSLNAFVTAKISFANMISEVCDQLPGADADVVAATLGFDGRIGGKYLKPGLAFGGPCFPRDNAALAAMARHVGAHADIPEATDAINRRQLTRMVELVRSLLRRGTVGVLGLSYKPATAVIEASPGVAIASALADAGYRVMVSDPEALGPATAVLGSRVEPATAEECAAAADVLIIATAWPCFRDLPRELLRRPGRRLPVIDCWRMFPEDIAEIEIIRLGRSTEQQPQTGAAADGRVS
jgi:UDPglucose 6-dehydrogenase